jgi:transketolase
MTLAAGRELATGGKAVRVVSMPCIELFEAQSQEYRDEVLPPGTTARLAVEPGASMSWWKWVGTGGDVLGIDRFGASAPGTTVLEKLGFTVENVVSRAQALLKRED